MKIFLVICFFTLSILSFASRDIEEIKYINTLFKNDYVQEAIWELESFVKRYPNSQLYNPALNMLGQSYFNNKEYEKSKSIYLKLLGTDFENDANFFLGRISVNLNELTSAENYLQDLKKDSQRYKTLASRIAESYYDIGDYDKAENLYRELIQYSGEYYSDSLIKLAVISFNKKEYVKVSAFLDEYIMAIDVLPTSIEPLVNYLLGFSYYQIGDIELAEKFYLKNEPYFYDTDYGVRSLNNLVRLYQEKKEKEKVITYAEKLVNTELVDSAELILSQVYNQNGDYTKSEKLFKSILERQENSQIRLSLINNYLRQKEYESALKEIDPLLGTEYNTEYYYYSIYILFIQEKFNEIIKRFGDVSKADIDGERKSQIYKMVANAAYNIEDYITAEHYYASLDGIFPLYRRALIARRIENYDKIFEMFQKYTEEFPDDDEFRKDFYIMASSAYIQNNMYEEAEKLYSEFLEKKYDSKIFNNLIAILYNQDQYSKVINNIEKIKTDDPQLQFYLAIAYMGINNYKDAINNFKKLLEIDDTELQERVYKNYINSLYMMERFKEVIAQSKIYLDKEFERFKVEILNKRGLSYFKIEDYENARFVFNQLIHMQEMEAYSNFMLAEIEYNLGEKDLAKSYYRDVVIKYPESELVKESLYWLISITYDLAEFEEAKEYIKQFISKFPNDREYLVDIAYLLGDIYLKNDEIELAIIEFEKVLEMTQDGNMKNNIITIIVNAYYENKNYELALKWLEKAEISSYKTIWSGILNEELGNEEKAISYYKMVVDDPQYGDRANYYLGQYFMSKNENEKAIEHLRTVLDYDISRYKDNAIFNLGLIFEREENYNRAITTFMRIKLLYQDSDLIEIANLKIGENYEKIGNVENAIKIYEEFEENYKDSRYYEFILEKLIAHHYNNDNIDLAKEYYNKLKSENSEKVAEYESFFENGGE